MSTRGWRYWLNDMQECADGEHGEFWADEFERTLDAHVAGHTNGTWQEWRDLRLAAEQERAALIEVLRRHLPKDRYGPDGENIGTYCSCGDWSGDYFADGKAGPFDEHLADAILTARLASESRALAEARKRLAACERLVNEPGVRHLQPRNWRDRILAALGDPS